jgi:hypothetical protein
LLRVSLLRSALKAHPALALFLAAWVVYNANCRPITTGDTAPAALLPFMLVLNGTVTFDPYASGLADLYGGNAYFLHRKGGHYYSNYPILTPLLLTPAYTPLRLIPGIRDWPLEKTLLLARILEKFWASLVAAMSVAFLFLLLRRLVEPKYAVALALIFAFGTNTWSTASQALWQHALCQLTIILSLLFILRFLESSGWWNCGLAALFGILSVAARPTNALFFGISAVVVLGFSHHRRRVVVTYGTIGLLCVGALVGYNVSTSGNVLGEYARMAVMNPSFRKLAKIAFGPSHGLFFYSPVLLFLFWGLARVVISKKLHPDTSVDKIHVAACATAECEFAKPARAALLISLGFFLSLLTLYGIHDAGNGGSCYGPRLMTDGMPAAVILLATCFPYLRRSRPAMTAFVCACVLSVAIQIVGAFCYPLGGPEGRSSWEWRNNPITRNASAGVYTKGYQALGDILRGRALAPHKYDLRVQ